MVARELLTVAREEVADLTGQEVEAVTGLQREDGESWVVTVEVLEVERIPKTMDLLATYAVTLSEDGDVLGFERRRRYHRAAVGESGGR